MTLEEVLAVMDNVANRLAAKFRFGYHGLDDMKQQARLESIEAMDRYDGVRPLENFLWTHAHNRLFNMKRNKYARLDKPCNKCPLQAYDPECKQSENMCTAFDDRHECLPFAGWDKRNSAKKNLMSPIEISGVRDEHESNMSCCDDIDIDIKELCDIIQENIDVDLRPDWIKMRFDIHIPKQRRIKVQEAIFAILEERGLYEPKKG